MPRDWFNAGIFRCPLLFVALLDCQAHCSVSFHHRGYHASIIVGDYLYIDGGEFTTWNGSGNGIEDGYGVRGIYCDSHDTSVLFQCQGNISTLPDLTSSWTNETAKLEKIVKVGPPLVNRGVLWQDAEGELFYAYDGGTSRVFGGSIPPSSNGLYEFTPDHTGSGAWTSASAPANTNFSQLSRCYGAAYDSADGLGFALGGVQDDNTVAGYGDAYPAGLVIYNTSSQQWSNISALGYSRDGTATNAAAHFVPSFGPSGLLFIFGGQVGHGSIDVSTTSVNFFDPVSRQWKAQEVTGTPPTSSSCSCVVGAKGDNGTYEIFFFGGDDGSNINATVALGTVFVLSLPAFNWQKATSTLGHGRTFHSCNIRNRQMIVIGGLVKTVADFNAVNDDPAAAGIYTSSPDPWPQGLGVFDLTEMAWANSYNASASPYITPNIVKNYYVEHARYPDSLLQDSTLREYFMVPAANNSISPNSPPEPASSSHPEPVSSSHTGAIAGGVSGGVLALLIIAIVLWRALRHRRRVKAHDENGFRKAELDASNSGLDDKQDPGCGHIHRSTNSAIVGLPQTFGRDNKHGRTEIEGRSLHEMEGGRPEVPARP